MTEKKRKGIKKTNEMKEDGKMPKPGRGLREGRTVGSWCQAVPFGGTGFSLC
jgi:hypothetical protein